MGVWSRASWLFAGAVALGACTSARDVSKVMCMEGEVLHHDERAVGCIHGADEGRSHAAERCRSGTLLPKSGIEYAKKPLCFICIYRDYAEVAAELAPGPYPMGFEPDVGCLAYFVPNDSAEYRAYLKKKGDIKD